MAIVLFFDKRLGKKKHFKMIFGMMKKDLFFNHIIGLSLEAYFEFYIFGVLNVLSAHFNSNGEVLGILIAVLSLLLVVSILPALSIYIFTRTKNILNNDHFKYCFGYMYENTKYDTKITLIYTTIFIFRRFTYLSIGLFITDSATGGLQIIGLLLLNLIVFLYLLFAKA